MFDVAAEVLEGLELVRTGRAVEEGDPCREVEPEVRRHPLSGQGYDEVVFLVPETKRVGRFNIL